MTEETENLVLELLRHMRSSLEALAADMSDVKLRLTALEEHLASQQMQLVGLNRRMDRFDERLARVERRLGLIDA
jgi:predicted  nucleic acid-binding Zn-ribbon protein